MNFTEYLTAHPAPIYEEEVPPALEDPGDGKVAKEDEKIGCPKGYRWDKKTMRCVPKSDKDSVDANKGGQKTSGPSAGYRVWGNTGYDGGYAWEEPNGEPTGDGFGGGGE